MGGSVDQTGSVFDEETIAASGQPVGARQTWLVSHGVSEVAKSLDAYGKTLGPHDIENRPSSAILEMRILSGTSHVQSPALTVRIH